MASWVTHVPAPGGSTRRRERHCRRLRAAGRHAADQYAAAFCQPTMISSAVATRPKYRATLRSELAWSASSAVATASKTTTTRRSCLHASRAIDSTQTWVAVPTGSLCFSPERPAGARGRSPQTRCTGALRRPRRRRQARAGTTPRPMTPRAPIASSARLDSEPHAWLSVASLWVVRTRKRRTPISRAVASSWLAIAAGALA